jgi:hypothetical protein
MPLKLILASAAISSVLAAVPAHAADLTVALDNQASAAAKEFYTSPVEVTGWSDNLLGAENLAPGASRQVVIRNGRDLCTFDLRIVFADGEEIEEPAVNLCESASYTIFDPPADD